MITLTADELSLVEQILKEQIPNAEVWAFGSRVGGKVKPHSDLDLAIISTEKLSFSQMGFLREAFSESNLPFRVDFVDWAAIDDEFKQIILANHEVIQAKIAK